MSILLTNIQRFSLHDGPGIRTTVYLKGCSLCCPWCSNPENIRSYPQEYLKDGIRGVYGQYMSADELLDELLKDRCFYDGELEYSSWNITEASLLKKLPGGITFSGGEPLLQIDEIESVIHALHKDGIHVAVETCLYVNVEQLRKAIELVDLFYVDVKILDPITCKKVLNADLALYNNNVKTLMKSQKPVVFRIPVIGHYTDGEDNQQLVCEFLEEQYNNTNSGDAGFLKTELIQEHKLGLSKYKALREVDPSYRIPVYHGISDEKMNLYREKVKTLIPTLETEICKA